MDDFDSKLNFFRKPTEVLYGMASRSPYLPSKEAYNAFKLPANIPLRNLKHVAKTIDLSELGIVIPHGRYKDRFEEGFRYGLAHNARTDIKKMTRPHNHGFCWAKCYYRKFSPGCYLAAAGSMHFKITAVE